MTIRYLSIAIVLASLLGFMILLIFIQRGFGTTFLWADGNIPQLISC